MSEPNTLYRGVLSAPKSHFFDDLWLAEAFSRGQAWLDLWALANDRPRPVRIRGVEVRVERGQLAWSVQSLAERWHWNRKKVMHFLEELQDERKVVLKSSNVTTIITVADYKLYNPETEPDLPLPLVPESTPDGTAEGTPERTAEVTADGTAEGTQNWGTGELGTREQRTRERGKGAPQRPEAYAEVPSDDEVGTFCRAWAGDMARGIPGGIPEVWWTGWLAAKLSSDRAFPRDWRRVLTLAFVSDWVAGHQKARSGLGKKNGAAGPEVPGGMEGLMERGEMLQQKALARQRAVQTDGPAPGVILTEPKKPAPAGATPKGTE